MVDQHRNDDPDSDGPQQQREEEGSGADNPIDCDCSSSCERSRTPSNPNRSCEPLQSGMACHAAIPVSGSDEWQAENVAVKRVSLWIHGDISSIDEIRSNGPFLATREILAVVPDLSGGQRATTVVTPGRATHAFDIVHSLRTHDVISGAELIPADLARA